LVRNAGCDRDGTSDPASSFDHAGVPYALLTGVVIAAARRVAP
jgi:hypothetical protein